MGVHNDALGVFSRFGLDGNQAIRTELQWLREQGCQVAGTTAHNSAPVYGAENFEMFQGLAFSNRRRCECEGKAVRLQQLDPLELGLLYEGNFPRPKAGADAQILETFFLFPPQDAIRTREWLRSYFCQNPTFDRDYEASIWLLAADSWMIATHGEAPELSWPVDLSQVIEYLEACAPASRVVFNIHPEYLFEAAY